MTSYSFESAAASAFSAAVSPTAKKPGSNQGCDVVVDSAESEAREADDTRCDWGVCAPSACQRFARPPYFLLWLCLSGFTQGMLVNGFLNAVLTSIERRFDLQSVETGLIASMFDIGAVAAVVPVTYFGRHYRRSRFVSVGALVLCTGSFVFAMPHFLAGRYVFASPVPPLCYTNGTDYPDLCGHGSHSGYRWFFWLGQLLHGAGASPFFTLAVAYLDDNLTVKQSGVYLGCYYVTNLVGPACGYLLGGLLLGVYVDHPSRPPAGSGLSPSDTAVWVGAWWTGLLISGAAAFVIAWPLFGFPKRFAVSSEAADTAANDSSSSGSNKDSHRRHRDDESHGDSAGRSAALGASVSDLLPSARVVLANPAFLCLSLAGTASIFVVTGLATFGPKLMQHFFHLTASSATLSIGLVLVPCGALGLLSGALTIRCLDLSLRALLRLNAVASALGLLLAGCFFVRCPAQGFAGLTNSYPAVSAAGGSVVGNLTSGCNADCHCLADKYMFAPVCDANGLQYYSACYAGCSAAPVLLDGRRYYSNCSCVATTGSVKGLSYSVVAGTCEENFCTSVPLFLAVFGVFMFFVFFITIPTVQATIRVIPAKLKDFGLGLQIGLIRILGSIPAPLLLGRLIDSSCLLWNGSCGESGSCGYYSSHGLWLRVLGYTAGFKALELLLLAAAALVYRPAASAAADSAGTVYAVEFKARPPPDGVDNGGFADASADIVSVSVNGSTVDLVSKEL